MAESFREDSFLRNEYQVLEGSVQRFVSIYLSALAAAVSLWLGHRLSLSEMISGNDGNNIHFLILIWFVNFAFMCFVLYKGLEIHELMQSAVNRSVDGSLVREWEGWRRSRVSLTRSIRVAHYAITSGFPVIVALILGGFLAVVVFETPGSLVAERAREAVLAGRWLWGFVALLHLIFLPFYIALNSSRANLRWRVLDRLPPRQSIDAIVRAMMKANEGHNAENLPGITDPVELNIRLNREKS
jgi:hypothetical protein